MADVWSNGALASNVVDVYVRRLRAKLGGAGGQLQTIRGVGYRFQIPEELRVNER
jgi:DNA-binding response OmpR family regulator